MRFLLERFTLQWHIVSFCIMHLETVKWDMNKLDFFPLFRTPSYLSDNAGRRHWRMWHRQQWIILRSKRVRGRSVTSHFMWAACGDAERSTGLVRKSTSLEMMTSRLSAVMNQRLSNPEWKPGSLVFKKKAVFVLRYSRRRSIYFW